MAKPFFSPVTIVAGANATALGISGTAAASTAGSGSAASDILQVTGPNGQPTSSNTNGVLSGSGAGAYIQCGNGGAHTGTTAVVTSGAGGSLTLHGGDGGSVASTSGTGGAGGFAYWLGGIGGAASAATGSTIGGAGGACYVVAGNGGAVSSASGTRGSGGHAYVSGGSAAAGTGSGGTDGKVALAYNPNSSTAAGGVGVRVAPASIATALHVKQSANTASGGNRLERSDNTNRWDNFVDSSNNLIWYYNGTSTGFYVDSSGDLVSTARIYSSTGFNGILGSDLATSPVRGSKLQWNDANTAMEWAQQSNASNFGAYSASALVHSSASTFLKVQLDSELFDGLSEFDTANKRFTAKRAGLYQFFAAMYVNGPAANTRVIMSVFVNGAEALRLFDWITGPTSDYIPSAGLPIVLAVGDVAEMYIFQSASSTTFAAAYTRMYGYRIL